MLRLIALGFMGLSLGGCFVAVGDETARDDDEAEVTASPIKEERLDDEADAGVLAAHRSRNPPSLDARCHYCAAPRISEGARRREE